MYSLGGSGDVQSSSSSSSSASSATLVSSQFITQYYRTLTTAIDSLYQFYEDDSSVVRVDDAEDNHDKKSSWITTTPQKGQLDIHNVSIPLPVSKVAIKTFDCAESGDGFLLLVHGSILLSGAERTFSQTFLLAFVDGRYYIKNEILRFHAPATINHNAVATSTTNAAPVQHTEAVSNHLNHHDTNNVAVVSSPVKSPVKPPTSPARGPVPSSPSLPSVVSSPNHEEKKHNRRKRHEATTADSSLLTPEQKAEKINDGSASPASKSPKVSRGAAVHSQQNESIPAVELSAEPVAEAVVEVAAPAPVQEEIPAPVQSAPITEVPKVGEKKVAPVKAAPAKPSTWAAIFTKNTPPPTAHSSAAAAAASAPVATPAPTTTNAAPAASSAPASTTRRNYAAKESNKSSTIMISNVPAVAKNDELQSLFSQFGTISDIVVNKSAAYVTFTAPSSVDAVLAQKSVTLFDVSLQLKRSTGAAPQEASDDGFQSSQNRRHQRAQQRHNDKAAPAPAFVPRGRGRGRGRGGFRGGRGGSNNAAPAESS